MLGTINKVLGRWGLVMIKREALVETIAALCCHQQAINDLLEKNQIAVYDQKTHTLTIETLQ